MQVKCHLAVLPHRPENPEPRRPAVHTVGEIGFVGALQDINERAEADHVRVHAALDHVVHHLKRPLPLPLLPARADGRAETDHVRCHPVGPHPRQELERLPRPPCFLARAHRGGVGVHVPLHALPFHLGEQAHRFPPVAPFRAGAQGGVVAVHVRGDKTVRAGHPFQQAQGSIHHAGIPAGLDAPKHAVRIRLDRRMRLQLAQ
mmetsp:Transcript_10541/g.13870  ORF Transcript_10541/g.13870 Transcript_10541/m.13870 type:complete len:203 (-) Transcript_10541:501-1109(-)